MAVLQAPSLACEATGWALHGRTRALLVLLPPYCAPPQPPGVRMADRMQSCKAGTAWSLLEDLDCFQTLEWELQRLALNTFPELSMLLLSETAARACPSHEAGRAWRTASLKLKASSARSPPSRLSWKVSSGR